MYSIQELSKLSGASKRTLRYYEEIGLLTPLRANDSGYRYYGAKEVDALQEILVLRAMGFSLQDIKKVMQDQNHNRLQSFENHLGLLKQEQERIQQMISTVEKTIQKEKGNCHMQDTEKFYGLKEKMIEENEKQYGKEIRERYGDNTVEDSNRKLMQMSKEDFALMQKTEDKLKQLLPLAVKENDPSSVLAEEIYTLHKQWLMFHWKQYNPETHRALGEMYLEDERFRAYYDNIIEGGAEVLKNILDHFCQKSS